MKAVWNFLNARKKWWLLPMVVVVLLMVGLLLLTDGAAFAPFIYSIF